jgi:hypothetical protein
MQLKYISLAVALIVASSTHANGVTSIQSGDGTRTTPKVSLCDLVANSKQYLGLTVTTTVRIEAFKHGTGIWDPTCRGKGSDLHFPISGRESSSVTELRSALRQTVMSDHPVIATLTGKWLGTQYYEHQFIAQPRIVFEVIEAKDITRSTKIERPY